MVALATASPWIHAPEAGETLEQVLDAIDPDNQLEIDEDLSSASTLRVELEGPHPAFGILRRFDERSYALVLGSAIRCEGLDQVVAKSPRHEGLQKWPPLRPSDLVRG